MKNIIFPLLILIVTIPLFSGVPSPDRVPEISFPAKSVVRKIHFFKDEPLIRFVKNDTLEVTIETLVPTIPGVLYYGHIHPDQNLPNPRYRFYQHEPKHGEGKEKTHTFQIPFSQKWGSPERTKYDVIPLAKAGGVVVLRLEFNNPKLQSSDAYETSFRYHKDSNGTRSLQPHFIAGPFYDTHGASHAVISFNLSMASAGRIRLRRKGSTSSRLIAFSSGVDQEVTLPGVQEGALYSYQVELPIKGGKSGQWYSYPEVSIRIPSSHFRPFSFACMSDSRSSHGGADVNRQGTNTQSIKQLFRMAYERGSDFLFFPGDLIDGYTTSVPDYEQQFLTWKKASTGIHRFLPIFEGMGNHEALIKRYKVPKDSKVQPLAYGSFSIPHPAFSSEAFFAKQFVNPKNGPPSEGGATPPYAETVYSVVLNGVGFLMLNTNYWYSSDPETLGGNLEGYIMDRQIKWMEEALTSFQSRKDIHHVFVFAHEPAFPNSVHIADAMYYHGGVPEKNGGFDRRWVVKRRDLFWKLLSTHSKVRFVMFGDEHNYSRTIIPPDENKGWKNPVTQLISGGVGAPYYRNLYNLPWSKHVQSIDWKQNFVHVTVKKDEVIGSTISITGEIIDQFSLR
jgi:hypothetical protein